MNFGYFRIRTLAANQKLLVVVIRCADKQSFSTFSILFMAHSGAVDLEMCDKLCANSLKLILSRSHFPLTTQLFSAECVSSLLFPQLLNPF